MSKKSISKRKKIIVTGGAGFIGSHLVERLVELKYNVIVIDDLSNGSLQNIKKVKQNIKFLKTDLNSKKIFKYFKNVEAVFHLAALADIVPSIENPKKYFYANVSATENILNISIKNNVKKFIYAASSSCYGIPNKYPTNENTILDPQYPYALSKKMGEDLVMHYGKIYKLNVCSLRLFNVYGPRSRTSGTYGAVFGVFLKQKLMNMPFTIVGNGKQKRDFTFVYDVVNAFLKAFISKKSNNQIFNVGSGAASSVNKIAHLLKGKKVHIPKRPGEPNLTFADIKKIKDTLKWVPKYKIEHGVKILIDNINYWKKAPLWTPKKIKKETKLWFKYLS